MGRILRACVVAITFVGVTSFARADGRPNPVFLVVSKSQNKNQVHYAMRVDEECRPSGALPAFAFWHMLERGRGVYEGLLSREQGVYGVSAQTSRGEADVTVRIAALPKRPLVVRTTKTASGGCRAEAFTTIAGVERARLEQVHAELAWPFGVRYLLLIGQAPDGRPLQEKASP